MIVVDTSVWISFFRNDDHNLVQTLHQLLDDRRVLLAIPTRIEILSGAGKRDQPKLRKVFSALPLLVPEFEDWELIEGWVTIASERGDRFGVADLLIAALCARHSAKLWSLDNDFERMERLGFIKRMI